MNIEVSPATEDEKPVVRRLLELNSHEFSPFDGRDLGSHGEYGYRYLDHYWIESENRHAFIVRVGGAIAGCVLVRAGSPHRFGEFFLGHSSWTGASSRTSRATLWARSLFKKGSSNPATPPSSLPPPHSQTTPS